VGKFYIYEKFKKMSKAKGIDVHRIDIDGFGHEILEVLTEPLYINLRKSIIDEFGPQIEGENGVINGKELGKILFRDLQKLHRFNQIIYRPLLLRLRRELYGKNGIILLDSALIIESEMTYLCNNNIILVTADKETQLQRIKQRKLTEEQIRHRTATQYTYDKKARLIQQQIDREKHGIVYYLDTSSPENIQKVEELFHQIIADFNIKPA
jgi:dephospho-CoA kinase